MVDFQIKRRSSYDRMMHGLCLDHNVRSHYPFHMLMLSYKSVRNLLCKAYVYPKHPSRITHAEHLQGYGSSDAVSIRDCPPFIVQSKKSSLCEVRMRRSNFSAVWSRGREYFGRGQDRVESDAIDAGWRQFRSVRVYGTVHTGIYCKTVEKIYKCIIL